MSNVEDQDGQADHRPRVAEAPNASVPVMAFTQPTRAPESDPRHFPRSGCVGGVAGVGPVQGLSSHYYGNTYNTVNTFYGPANVFNHVENMVFEGNSDLTTLNALFPHHPPVGPSTSGYLPNSRLEDENVVWRWIGSRVAAPILWIHGPAGIGKSTLAQHIQQQLRSERHLAAAIFLSAFRPNSPTPETIIRLIAGELGRIHNEAISAILKAHRHCHGLPPEALVERLIIDAVRSLHFPQPLIVVLDAADEWAAHTAFVEAFSCLDPSLLRFIVLGRLEPQGKRSKLSIRLHPLGRVSNKVTEDYLNWRVNQVEWGPEPKPSSYDLKRLAEKADGLFIWAVTACSLLEDELSPSSPRETLAAILDSRRSLGESNDLTALYRSAIALLFPRPEDQSAASTFIGAILVLQEPLPLPAFSRLVGMREALVTKVQARLKALQIKTPNHHLKIHPAGSSFHLSLIEFFHSASAKGDPILSISTFDFHARFAEVTLREVTHLPLVSLDSAIPPVLSSFQEYIVKYLALHLSSGAPEVKPGSTSDWEASRLCCNLRQAPIEALRRWCSLLLSLVEPGAKMPTGEYTDGDKGLLMMDAADSLQASENLQPFRIPCLGIAVRLLPDHEDAWYAQGDAWRDSAKVSTARNAVERAVMAFQNGLEARVPSEVTGKSRTMFALANALSDSYERFGIWGNLGEALDLNRRLLALCPDGHPDRSASLNNLANCLGSQYEKTGSDDDLREATELQREALALCPDGHPDRSMSLNNLAVSLQSQYRKTGSDDNLREATELRREALALCPDGHPDRSMRLNNLASSLQSQYRKTGSDDNLREATELQREALALCPDGHPDRSMSLSNLAVSLQSQYEKTGSDDDIREATELQREALALCPDGHPSRSMRLDNLSVSLELRYKKTGSNDDLQEAIALRREVLALRPLGHRYHCYALERLARALRLTGAEEALREAASLEDAA